MRRYGLRLTSKIILIVFSLFIISLGGYLLANTKQLKLSEVKKLSNTTRHKAFIDNKVNFINNTPQENKNFSYDSVDSINTELNYNYTDESDGIAIGEYEAVAKIEAYDINSSNKSSVFSQEKQLIPKTEFSIKPSERIKKELKLSVNNYIQLLKDSKVVTDDRISGKITLYWKINIKNDETIDDKGNLVSVLEIPLNDKTFTITENLDIEKSGVSMNTVVKNPLFYKEKLVLSIVTIICGISLFLFSIFFTKGFKVQKIYFLGEKISSK